MLETVTKANNYVRFDTRRCVDRYNGCRQKLLSVYRWQICHLLCSTMESYWNVTRRSASLGFSVTADMIMTMQRFCCCWSIAFLLPLFVGFLCLVLDVLFMLGSQPNHGWQLCFPLKLHAGGSDFRLYDGSDLKTYLLMRW